VKEEMDSMAKNQVWKIVKFLEGVKAVGCKWVYKTKLYSNHNIGKHNAKLITKGFT
jgi:hypothetical protein